jgi:GT2 family glycosyltransferase
MTELVLRSGLDTGLGRSVLSVSIVVYRRSPFLGEDFDRTLADAISHLAQNPLCGTILVLDNSPGNHFHWTTSLSARVVYIHFSGSNLGYARAHNVAQYLADSPYHLILNPDIVFSDSHCLDRLLAIVEAEPDIALIQPLITSPDNARIQFLCKRNPTFLSQLGRGFLGSVYFRLMAAYDSWYVMRDLAYGHQPVESQYLSGCFMLCRRSCLDRVGWFDPQFFMYLEDADLTRRLSAIGRCIHEPRIRVGHVWARGSHQNLRLRLVAISSYFRYGAKWGFRLV